METNNRFLTRELTVRERIYVSKAAMNDFEALVKLIESRAIEPIDGLYDMPESDFEALAKECFEGMKEALKVSRALSSVAADSNREIIVKIPRR